MCRTTAEIQQVDMARDGTNNRKETIFKSPNHNILHITLNPSSPVYILKDILYYMTVDRYATNSQPILHRQSTDIPQTVYQYSTDNWHSLYQLRVNRYTCHVSANMSTCSWVSVNTLAAISVECRPTYGLTCWPTVNRYGDRESTDISADSVNRYSIEGCTNYTRSEKRYKQ